MNTGDTSGTFMNTCNLMWKRIQFSDTYRYTTWYTAIRYKYHI